MPQDDPEPEYLPPREAPLRTHPGHWSVRGGQLWAGAFATGVIASLVTVVGLLVARAVLGVDVLRPHLGEAFGNGTAARYLGCTWLAVLLATAVLHALILTTPQPLTFFSWIVTLTTLVGALLPLLRDAATDAIVATVLLNVAIGGSIGICLSSLGARTMRWSR